jgi:hypothetical protein
MATKAATVTADPVVEIESLRQQIAALHGEIAELMHRDTLRPRPEAEAYIRELVATAAAQGESPTELVAEVATRLSQTPGFGILEQLNKRHGFSLLCTLAPELVERSLCAGLDGTYSQGLPVLSFEEQAERRRVLEEQLFDIELEEEKLISALEAHGRPAPMRRGDANPAAVLHESTLSAMESGYETD